MNQGPDSCLEREEHLGRQRHHYADEHGSKVIIMRVFESFHEAIHERLERGRRLFGHGAQEIAGRLRDEPIGIWDGTERDCPDLLRMVRRPRRELVPVDAPIRGWGALVQRTPPDAA